MRATRDNSAGMSRGGDVRLAASCAEERFINFFTSARDSACMDGRMESEGTIFPRQNSWTVRYRASRFADFLLEVSRAVGRHRIA